MKTDNRIECKIRKLQDEQNKKGKDIQKHKKIEKQFLQKIAFDLAKVPRENRPINKQAFKRMVMSTSQQNNIFNKELSMKDLNY